MQTTRINGIETEVSRIALGTWAIGGWMWGGAEDAQSIQTIHRALDLGITLIDTAPVYGFGRSEEVVGRAIAEAGARGKVAIATKVGLEWSDDHQKIRRNSSPARIRKEVEDSLRRLQTDRIDLYQVHWPDESVPFAETAAELERLREEGKILAIGVSNYTPEQLDAFRASAPLASNQPPYNLFERGIENDVLPYCRENNIATLAYGALCRGLLSGKMNRDTKFEGDDLRRNDPKFQSDRFPQYLAAVDALQALARERYDRDVLHLAVRWILDRGVEIALWGARRPEQVEAVTELDGFSIDDEAMAEIDRILKENVTDPVGPEFMAPPRSK